MPANKILFADYQNFPKPKLVYLDANFAVDLLYYEINHATNPSALRQRELDCFAFYQQLKQDGVGLVGSVFTFSETLQLYAFSYPNGMYHLTDQFLTARGLGHIMAKPRHERFKFFLKNFPADCEAAWRSISYRVGATEEFFDNYGIRLIHPLPSPQLTNITKNVVNFASVLMDFFVAIEATDSLHLSLATYLRTDAVVSLDSGFCTVDNFTVYAHT
ncbi:MAG TPA: hypothetical protein VE263_14385 [Candidatus Angelobacter sp.]|nr:hypothetical protein [Candidatus Angelobacter sp.]